MKLYTVRCPLCGTVNRDLYLDETDGLMECEHCHQVVKAPTIKREGEFVSIPVYTLEDFATHIRPALRGQT